MPGVNKYTKQYINDCRSKVNLHLSTYKKLVETARKQVGKNENSINPAIESFEPVFFNNMVLHLDVFLFIESKGE